MDKLFLSKLIDWVNMCDEGLEREELKMLTYLKFQFEELKQILEAEEQIKNQYGDDVVVEYYEIPDYLH